MPGCRCGYYEDRVLGADIRRLEDLLDKNRHNITGGEERHYQNLIKHEEKKIRESQAAIVAHKLYIETLPKQLEERDKLIVELRDSIKLRIQKIQKEPYSYELETIEKQSDNYDKIVQKYKTKDCPNPNQ